MEDPSAVRVLLVTAHPDDETMFFTPTLTAISHIIKNAQGSRYQLTNRSESRMPEVHILCLSNGNYCGLGAKREVELKSACEEVFLIPSHRVTVVDSTEHQDGPWAWNPECVARSITQQMKKQLYHIIITFDSRGVSHHPNHISCFDALSHCQHKSRVDLDQAPLPHYPRRRHATTLDDSNMPQGTHEPEIWVLQSVHSALAYSGLYLLYSLIVHFLLIPACCSLAHHLVALWQLASSTASSLLTADPPIPPSTLLSPSLEHGVLMKLLTSSSVKVLCRRDKKGIRIFTLTGWITSLRGMMCHRSQLVWYRYLHVIFSSYVTFNRLILLRKGSSSTTSGPIRAAKR